MPLARAAKLSALLAGFGVVFLSTLAHAQNISCTCRYKGSDYGVGESICLKSPNGMKMATCSMVLNNTSWKFTNAPCPLSMLPLEYDRNLTGDIIDPRDGTTSERIDGAREELG
nr:hypothetical protein [uncultured Roseibium sp.]